MVQLYNPNKVSLAKVVAKSFLLGSCFLLNWGLILLQYFDYMAGSLYLINMYLIVLTIFHLLEFVSTCLWNNSEVDDDSFILEDYQMMAVNVIAILEYIITRGWKPFYYPVCYAGISLIVIGQIARSLAMYTAGASFNHYIQRDHQEKHKLVTHGAYRVVRHPSYFGFWWWFIGLQLLVNNIITLIVGGVILWRFFNARIEFEEALLIKFFGSDYEKYRASTRVWIPFIN